MFAVVNEVDGELDVDDVGETIGVGDDPDDSEVEPPELLLPHAARPMAATGIATAS